MKGLVALFASAMAALGGRGDVAVEVMRKNVRALEYVGGFRGGYGGAQKSGRTIRRGRL